MEESDSGLFHRPGKSASCKALVGSNPTSSAMKKIRLAVFTGGESTEREVSFWSAKNVSEILKDKYEIKLFDIPKQIPDFLNEKNSFDLVIPMLHGKGGEDGEIQGFLRALKIPFIFSDVTAHAISMNKKITNYIAERNGVKVPDYTVIKTNDSCQFTKKIVVKPIDGGSSVGVTIVKTEAEFIKALNLAFDSSTEVMLQDFIGGEEFTVGVIEAENKMTVALPVIQIKTTHEFFDYKAKYTTGLSEEICPAVISTELSGKLQSLALVMHKILNIKHMSRSDFIVDKEENIWFLEINTIPGFTKNSLIPKAIRASGRDTGAVIETWINDVLDRTKKTF